MRAARFFAAGFLRAARFFAAGFRLAAGFFLARLAARFLAAGFFAARFLAGRFLAGRFLAARFFAAGLREGGRDAATDLGGVAVLCFFPVKIRKKREMNPSVLGIDHS